MRVSRVRHPWLVRVLFLSVIGVVGGIVTGCITPDPVLPPISSSDPTSALLRGQTLVTGFGACGFCHSQDGVPASPLIGGRVMRDTYGDVQGPNITFSDSGIGSWSDADLKRGIRENLHPDASVIAPDAHKGLEWLSDVDITAITYYLRSLPPERHSVSHRTLSLIDRNITGFFDTRLEVKGYIPAIAPSFKVESGQYLTDHVARCGSCHSTPGGVFTSEEYLAGSREVSFDGETKVAPNITSSQEKGIGAWSEDAIKTFLRSGRTPQGREVDARFCPVRFYAQAPSDQIDAVVAYLRTVPAIE